MGSKYFRAPKMSPIQEIIWQLSSIRKTYSNIESYTKTNNSFSCIMNITPSENSDTYKVEISYQSGYYPKAKLLSHKLEERNGKLPHHTYGCDKEGCARLCVFHQKSGEWNSKMLISQSFIPWVSTWLNAYEFWLITGEWHYDEIIASKEESKKDECKQ